MITIATITRARRRRRIHFSVPFVSTQGPSDGTGAMSAVTFDCLTETGNLQVTLERHEIERAARDAGLIGDRDGAPADLPPTLFVAGIEHRHAVNTTLHRTRADALTAVAAFCRAGWTQELPETPLPGDDPAVVETFFGVTEQYSYSITEAPLPPRPGAPAAPAATPAVLPA